MFLDISQNSQENTCARAYFLIKLQAPPGGCFWRIFFEELNRLAEELQNITPEDTIKFKERIREALNGLQCLKVTKCESMQQLKLLENVFNVFYQDLSSQSQSLDPRVLVFRRTVSTLTHGGAGRLKYEIPEEHLMYFKSLCFAWNHGTTIRTVITCKKTPCYMRDSAFRWFIAEKAKIF